MVVEKSVVIAQADISRFASKIQRGGRGCWRWCGTFDRNGYGTFSVAGRTVRAHRLAYQLAKGAPRKHVLHKCGNRWCVNPSHLRDGTLQDNVQDMRRHGTLATGARNGMRRHPEAVARGARAGAAKLTEAQVRSIRESASNGASVGALARRYKVHKSTISRAVNGVQWEHVR